MSYYQGGTWHWHDQVLLGRSVGYADLPRPKARSPTDRVAACSASKRDMRSTASRARAEWEIRRVKNGQLMVN